MHPDHEELNAETLSKINELAASLKERGLADTMEEAVEKAKAIVLGESESETADEFSEDMKNVKKDLE